VSGREADRQQNTMPQAAYDLTDYVDECGARAKAVLTLLEIYFQSPRTNEAPPQTNESWWR
jgi:hypothetical protein